ncbi:hypothetical protein ACFYR1_51240 [Streptomyces canus]|uniref:hypothetical protein n=1 Tax=Streptomyces canus TaxID=58343 RepID=UPI0036901B58
MAADQDAAGQREGVGVGHPQQALPAGMQIKLETGQGHVHDRMTHVQALDRGPSVERLSISQDEDNTPPRRHAESTPLQFSIT